VSIKLKVLSVIVLFAAFGVVIFLWDHFHLPTSVNETIFRHRLTEKASQNAPNIILSELMPGNWELICDSHGYDGPLYLKQYNKTYPPAAPPQDGVWGLIFVNKDGSYTSAIQPYGKGVVYLSLEPHGCLERTKAVLVRIPESRPHYGTHERLTKQRI